MATRHRRGEAATGGSSGTSFTVYKSRQAFKDARFRNVEGITDGVQEVMREARPYRRGNKTLWRLNQLDVVDKHRLLVAASASRHTLTLNLDGENEIEIPLRPLLNMGGRSGGSLLKRGYAVFSLPRDSIQAQNPKLATEVVVNEPGLIKSESILGLAVTLADGSQRLIEAFSRVLR